MIDTHLPLIDRYQPERVFAWRNGQAVCAAEALADIQTIAHRLPGHGAIINACADRYLFTVAFAAAIQAGRLTLLPQNRSDSALNALRAIHADANPIDDACVADWLPGPARPEGHSASVPLISVEQCVAVVFTSGSTGAPHPHLKVWGELSVGSHSMYKRFFRDADNASLVATVPPQHMYGLETSILPALHVGLAADTRCPLLPGDVAAALARVPAPRVLVTTPMHLRACLASGVPMPAIARVICASAPLAAELAAAVEAGWKTQVHEIFGSSETGSIASRRTIDGDTWRLYCGLSLTDKAGPRVAGGHLREPCALADSLTIIDSQHFCLLGRAHDLLKVAGKRMSLANLNAELAALPGIDDAVVFKPAGEIERERPVALVVSARDPREIAAELARRLDPVFVPRPILRVAALPRNALGKLPQTDLARAWAAASQARCNRRS